MDATTILAEMLREGRATPNEVRAISDTYRVGILAERKRCADAVLAEKLAGETNDPTDISYNVAIEHAHDAIWRTA